MFLVLAERKKCSKWRKSWIFHLQRREKGYNWPFHGSPLLCLIYFFPASGHWGGEVNGVCRRLISFFPWTISWIPSCIVSTASACHFIIQILHAHLESKSAWMHWTFPWSNVLLTMHAGWSGNTFGYDAITERTEQPTNSFTILHYSRTLQSILHSWTPHTSTKMHTAYTFF